ncbi:MAG: hypothetical protein ACNA8J_03240 [Gammaproteobacteria bacterium]
MYEQPQLGIFLVVALYAIAGVLAIIGGVMVMRVRRRRKDKESR